MDLFFYFIGFSFLLVPYFFKHLSFFDIIPLFLFYFDAVEVFINHVPSFRYFEYALIFFYSLYVIFNINSGKFINGFYVFTFLLISYIIFPLAQNTSINLTLRSYSINYASMALLPLAFFHYSRKPNLKFLLNSTFVLIVSFVLYVLLATPMQLGGFESERIAGTTFYYGNIAIRGGITYFSFVILLSPLLINYIKSWQKIILIMAIPIVLVFFLTALKRFVFLVVFLGILNYLFRPTMQTKYRLRIGFLTLIISLGVLSADFVQNATSERYLERGADRKFSTEAIESDMRIYEPYSVFMSILNKPIYNILIGEKGRPEYDIEHSGTVARRVIHNTYASLLSEIGIIGLILYLLIYYKFYTKIYFFYRSIKSYKKEYLLYWIAFQNMFLIFIIQGMVGGQIHVTLRGLVFLYSGALGGYFYSEYNKYKQQID